MPQSSTKSWSAPATPEVVARLRGEIAGFAAEAGIGGPPLADVRLAVSEALSNVVMHSYRGDPKPGRIDVAAEISDDELHVVIADGGSGMAPRADSPGAGLGLPIMASLAGGFEVRSRDPRGTELHLCFPV